MALSEVLQIPIIGLLMAIGTDLPAQSPVTTTAAEAPAATRHPVLGFYIVDGSGKAIIQCPSDTPALDAKHEYPMLTLEGIAGTLQNIKLAPGALYKPEVTEQPSPLLIYDLSNKPMTTYVGEQKATPRKQDGPSGSLAGIILPPGSRVQKTEKKGEFLLVTAENKFYIKACMGIEGPRFSCLSYPARRHLCQFYYYVGYDTEEDCEPERVQP